MLSKKEEIGRLHYGIETKRHDKQVAITFTFTFTIGGDNRNFKGRMNIVSTR